MLAVNVSGGTNAGCKKPPFVKVWRCCGKTLTAYSCCECGRRRDDA